MALKKLDLKMTSPNTPAPYIVTHNGILGSNMDAYFLFDNSTVTNYHSNNGSGRWVQIFLGKKYILQKIGIHTRTNDAYNPQTPSNMIIQGSNDGVSYTQLFNSKISVGYNQYYTFNINNNKGYMYYKFIFESSTGYVVLSTMDLFVSDIKCLIVLDTGYFSIDERLYNVQVQNYSLFTKDIPIEQMLNYIFNISALSEPMTIGAETFKPIDKLNLLNKSYSVLYIKTLT